PYGLGAVLVRDIGALLAAYRATAHYLQDTALDSDAVSPAVMSPEQTKHFRALRMWLPLVTLGAAPFRAALREKLLLARYFYDRVAALGFEVAGPPDLSVIPFRWVPEGAPLEQVDRVNEAIVIAVRDAGRVFFSSTRLNGRFWLRLAILSFR